MQARKTSRHGQSHHQSVAFPQENGTKVLSGSSEFSVLSHMRARLTRDREREKEIDRVTERTVLIKIDLASVVPDNSPARERQVVSSVSLFMCHDQCGWAPCGSQRNQIKFQDFVPSSSRRRRRNREKKRTTSMQKS